MSNLHIYLQIPVFIFLFIFGLRILIPLFVSFNIFVLENFNFRYNLNYEIFKVIFEYTKPTIKVYKTLFGLVVIIIGVYLILLPFHLTDFLGSFLVVVGIQITLWALGITSELLSNKRYKSKSADFRSKDIKSSYLGFDDHDEELFNKAFRIWHKNYLEHFDKMSPYYLNELMYETRFDRRNFKEHLINMYHNLRKFYSSSHSEYIDRKEILIKLEETNKLIIDLNKQMNERRNEEKTQDTGKPENIEKIVKVGKGVKGK